MPDSLTSQSHPFPHIIVRAEDGEQLVPLRNANFWTIGRGYNNSIVLADRWVSRNHATLQIIAMANTDPIDLSAVDAPDPARPHDTLGNFYLVDLGSRNGSFVNSQRITSPVLLKSSDRLVIGKTEMDFFLPREREHHRAASDFLNLFQQPTAPVSRLALTPSEERVFWQVVQGFTNKEIGRRLQISPRTVQTHLSSIMTKLNLGNRSQIVRFAFEHSLRPPESTQLL